jgi:hypothetical protein
MIAMPTIEPRTIARIFAGKGVPLSLLSDALDAAVDATADAVWEALDVADDDETEEPSPCWETVFVPNTDVALAQQLSLALNMHSTSSSFPPDITTSPL